MLVGVLIVLRNHRRGYFESMQQPGTFFMHGPGASTGQVLEDSKASPHWTQGAWGAQLDGNGEPYPGFRTALWKAVVVPFGMIVLGLGLVVVFVLVDHLMAQRHAPRMFPTRPIT